MKKPKARSKKGTRR